VGVCNGSVLSKYCIIVLSKHLFPKHYSVRELHPTEMSKALGTSKYLHGCASICAVHLNVSGTMV
jgi:hypothetical protein